MDHMYSVRVGLTLNISLCMVWVNRCFWNALKCLENTWTQQLLLNQRVHRTVRYCQTLLWHPAPQWGQFLHFIIQLIVFLCRSQYIHSKMFYQGNILIEAKAGKNSNLTGQIFDGCKWLCFRVVSCITPIATCWWTYVTISFGVSVSPHTFCIWIKDLIDLVNFWECILNQMSVLERGCPNLGSLWQAASWL